MHREEHSTYSGSVWSLAVMRLQDDGLLEDPDIDWEFDVAEAGRIEAELAEAAPIGKERQP